MKQNHIKWLYDQLPDLVSGGVVSAEAADKLRQHYGPLGKTDGRRIALVLFGLLGAVLIGGGIILLIAYNWSELTRPVRAAISFAPLVLAQVLASWVLWQRRDSTAWRESSGAFLTIAIGASIALVSQTYHIPGDLGAFMLSWTLLALPVAYLMGATLPALFYLVGILVWTGDSIGSRGESMWFWPLLAAVIPYIWWTARADRYHPRPVILCWVASITAIIGAGLALHDVLDEYGAWIVLYSSFFGVLYLAGHRWWHDAPAAWQRPFQAVGGLGGVGLALLLSFEDVWKISVDHLGSSMTYAERPITWAMIGAIAVIAIGLWVMALRDRITAGAGAAPRSGDASVTVLILGALPVLALLGVALVPLFETQMIGMLLFNAYLLVLGIGVLVSGLQAGRVGTVNAGMLILSATIGLRFIDADLGMVVRGIAFILLGIGFLATNLVLTRKKGDQ